MASQLSDLDFQRLQENLLELKNQNYNLDAQAKKSKHALGDATSRVKVLEEALEKATRTLDRSKKGSELQHLIKENEGLNQKLRFQEEQANEQNQAMMKELCSLVKRNEQLELELHLKGSSSKVEKDLGESESSDVDELSQKLKNQKIKLDLEDKSLEVNELTRKLDEKQKKLEEKDLEIGRLIEEKAKQDQDVKNLQEEKSALLYEVGELRRNLSGAQDALHDLKDTEERIEAQHLKEIEDLKLQIAQHPPEKFQELEARTIILKNEAQSYKDQVEKEMHRSKLLSSDLENDRVQLEQLHRQNEANSEAMAKLELDLTTAHNLCSTRKQLVDEMAKESQAQIDKIRELSIQYEERLKEVEHSHNESISQLQATIQNRQAEIHSLGTDHQQELNKLEETNQKALVIKDDKIAHLEEEIISIKCDLESRDKVIKECELEKCDSDKQIQELQSNINRLESAENCRSRELETQLELSNVQKVEFEEQCARLEGEIRDLQEEKKVIERKGHGRLKDLKKELMREQRKNEKLQEKFKDCFIDTESNHSDQTSNLDADRSSISSWSLMSGQNERDRDQTSTPCQLSPGLPSSYSDTSLNNIIEYSNGNRSSKAETKITQVPSSISLQQMAPISSSNQQLTGANSLQQLQGLAIKIPQNNLIASSQDGIQSQQQNRFLVNNKDTETAALLDKIAGLQEEKWRLEENLQMLEQSGAAMAQDILGKTNLIQFYCMDSRRPQQVANIGSPSQSKGADKVKQFVGKLDRLVHSEQTELHNKEMQRMQQMLEETLTKNMFLQQNMDSLSQELVRLSKLVPPS